MAVDLTRYDIVERVRRSGQLTLQNQAEVRLCIAAGLFVAYDKSEGSEDYDRVIARVS